MLRFVTSGAADLAVERSGSGPALVFLHAGVGDRRMWRGQVGAFGTRFTSLAYDRRGFGETRYAAEPHDPVEDLRAVLDAMGGRGAATLVGCSQGGRIAINFALTYPERVSRLVLINTAVSGAPTPPAPADLQPLLEELATAEVAGDAAWVNRIEARLWLDGSRETEGRVGGAARKLLLEMNAVALAAADTGKALETVPDAYDRLSTMVAPALVIAGKRDARAVIDTARHLVATMANARLAQMDTAHLPSLEAPAALNALLADFLREPT